MSTDDRKPTGPMTSREMEVAATPEQVWQAIATGAGNAGWLFPAEIEEREGGSMLIHRAPYGGDAPATVTAYEPPRRFAYEEQVGPDTPPWATEFIVEGRGGGTTVVRVVTGFYEGGEGWEPMVEGAGEGWEGALQFLRVYVTNFLGRPVVNFGAMGDTGQPLGERSALSAELLGGLGLTGLKADDKYQAPEHAPPLAGILETDVGVGKHGCVLRTDEPGPGIFEVSTFSMDGKTVSVFVVGRLYGEGGATLASRDGSRWATWLKERFGAEIDERRRARSRIGGQRVIDASRLAVKIELGQRLQTGCSGIDVNAIVSGVDAGRSGQEAQIAVVVVAARAQAVAAEADILHPFTDSKKDLQEAIDKLQPSHGGTDFKKALTLVEQLPADDRETHVYLVTDGSFDIVEFQPPSRTRFAYLRVGAKADNVGISTFSVRPLPSSPRDFQVHLEITNDSEKDRRVPVELRIDGRLADAFEFDLPAGKSLTRTLRQFSAEGGEIEAFAVEVVDHGGPVEQCLAGGARTVSIDLSRCRYMDSTFIGTLLHLLRIVQRNAMVYRRAWRGSLFFSFLQPVLFLVAMGAGVGALVDRGGAPLPGGVGFLTFLGPGLLAAACMQTATFESTWSIKGKIDWDRIYDAITATPLGIRDLVFGELTWIALRLTMVASAFTLVMTAFGVPQSPLVVLAIPAAVLTGLAFSAPLIAYAATLDASGEFNAVYRFGITPLFLFSGTFFPIDQLPGGLQPLAFVSPLWHGVDLTRIFRLDGAGYRTLSRRIADGVTSYADAIIGVAPA